MSSTSFVHQVGGHPSTILSSPLSSSTLIKPASATELAFYQSVAPTLANGQFRREWLPEFYGTLKLQGRVDGEAAETGEQPADMLVLENLTHRFKKPNILDVKLGQVLYDPDTSSPEKVAKMEKAAATSTSGELGLRLTGFQVWDYERNEYVQTPKPFGRTLLSSELDLGLSRFFYPSLTALSTAERSSSSSASSSSAPVSPATFPPSSPSDLILPILRTLVRRLQSLVESLKQLELRIRGSSLLIIIEGDPDQLERSLLRAAAARPEDDEEEDEDDEDDAESTDEDGNALEKTLIPFEIKMIDFAHTKQTLGQGYDEGVVLGVETLIKGLQGLIERIKQ
ncbi:inositol polyphosphate multikinase [Sporobolomyces koalae]|uniref:inositol polyphosphate multikinase n=1 Tax=Sporobolomyces koalae TaxID=500713 RepID=UPI00317C97D2